MTGTIHPTGAPEISQPDPEVMLQTIIYDGLVGDSFLRNFIVSFDVSGVRIVFRILKPELPRPPSARCLDPGECLGW